MALVNLVGNSFSIDNGKDDGSLAVGDLIGTYGSDGTADKIRKGDKLTVNGKVYTVTYLMRSKDASRNRVCAKGSGPFPMGVVTVTLGEKVAAEPTIEELRAKLAEMESAGTEARA